MVGVPRQRVSSSWLLALVLTSICFSSTTSYPLIAEVGEGDSKVRNLWLSPIRRCLSHRGLILLSEPQVRLDLSQYPCFLLCDLSWLSTMIQCISAHLFIILTDSNAHTPAWCFSKFGLVFSFQHPQRRWRAYGFHGDAFDALLQHWRMVRRPSRIHDQATQCGRWWIVATKVW